MLIIQRCFKTISIYVKISDAHFGIIIKKNSFYTTSNRWYLKGRSKHNFNIISCCAHPFPLSFSMPLSCCVRTWRVLVLCLRSSPSQQQTPTFQEKSQNQQPWNSFLTWPHLCLLIITWTDNSIPYSNARFLLPTPASPITPHLSQNSLTSSPLLQFP